MEQWRAVVGIPGYMVSDEGRVRSAERGLLRKKPDRYGYNTVRLVQEGKRREFLVHSLVMAAFEGPKRDGQECLHRDGDPGNDRLPNLYYGDDQENADKRERLEHTAKAARNGRARLSAAQVASVRRRREKGETFRALAAAFDVDPKTIRDICKRTNWSDVR